MESGKKDSSSSSIEKHSFHRKGEGGIHFIAYFRDGVVEKVWRFIGELDKILATSINKFLI